LGSFLLKCTLNSFNVSMFSSIVSKGSFFPKWLLCAFNLLPRANCDRIKQILLFHLSAIFLRKDITRGRLRLFACDTLITKLLSSSVWLYCLYPFSSSLWLYCLDSFSSSFLRNYFNLFRFRRHLDLTLDSFLSSFWRDSLNSFRFHRHFGAPSLTRKREKVRSSTS